jgi:hypothetical protein
MTAPRGRGSSASRLLLPALGPHWLVLEHAGRMLMRTRIGPVACPTAAPDAADLWPCPPRCHPWRRPGRGRCRCRRCNMAPVRTHYRITHAFRPENRQNGRYPGPSYRDRYRKHPANRPRPTPPAGMPRATAHRGRHAVRTPIAAFGYRAGIPALIRASYRAGPDVQFVRRAMTTGAVGAGPPHGALVRNAIDSATDRMAHEAMIPAPSKPAA